MPAASKPPLAARAPRQQGLSERPRPRCRIAPHRSAPSNCRKPRQHERPCVGPLLAGGGHVVPQVCEHLRGYDARRHEGALQGQGAAAAVDLLPLQQVRGWQADPSRCAHGAACRSYTTAGSIGTFGWRLQHLRRKALRSMAVVTRHGVLMPKTSADARAGRMPPPIVCKVAHHHTTGCQRACMTPCLVSSHHHPTAAASAGCCCSGALRLKRSSTAARAAKAHALMAAAATAICMQRGVSRCQPTV